MILNYFEVNFLYKKSDLKPGRFKCFHNGIILIVNCF
jgi:hypothetical protein